MRCVTREAPAKINLGLQVVGRRPDGYHELVTVLQTIELSDTVTVEPAATIEGQPSLLGLAAGDDLALRAAHLFQTNTRHEDGAHVAVEKRIPAAAGLGGGSSDAAAVLVAINELWGTGADRDDLERVASAIGADVPFLLRGGTQFATSRGDELRDLPSAPMRHVLLVRPHIELATAEVYMELRPSEWSDGTATNTLAGAISEGQLPTDVMRNDLKNAAVRLAPEIDEILTALQAAGAQPALMAGSGATCYGLFTEEAEAQSAQQQLSLPDCWTHLTRFLPAKPG
jgi:4-diphosphocytidyl-2-C-methyl-D-erythritol kinase